VLGDLLCQIRQPTRSRCVRPCSLNSCESLEFRTTGNYLQYNPTPLVPAYPSLIVYASRRYDEGKKGVGVLVGFEGREHIQGEYAISKMMGTLSDSPVNLNHDICDIAPEMCHDYQIIHEPCRSIFRVSHGYGFTRGASEMGTTGTGTVLDFGTPRHTAYPYHGVAGIYG
jgi:hypothetical protein